MRSVEVILRLSMSEASTAIGSNARSSSEELTGTRAGFATASFALRVERPAGCFPGRYGRNVIAGSVSSGMSILRSCS